MCGLLYVLAHISTVALHLNLNLYLNPGSPLGCSKLCTEYDCMSLCLVMDWHPIQVHPAFCPIFNSKKDTHLQDEGTLTEYLVRSTV